MKIDLETAQTEIDELIILLDLKSEECEEWQEMALRLKVENEYLRRDYKAAEVL